MHLHAIFVHIEGYVRHMQEVIGEVFLDQVTLVSTADHKVVDTVLGIDFEDVPQDGAAANFYHRLGAQARLFAEACSQTACQNNRFHFNLVALPDGH